MFHILLLDLVAILQQKCTYAENNNLSQVVLRANWTNRQTKVAFNAITLKSNAFIIRPHLLKETLREESEVIHPVLPAMSTF
jgi:hypothetical protein